MHKNDPYSKIESGQIKPPQAKNTSVRLPRAVQQQNREGRGFPHGGKHTQKER